MGHTGLIEEAQWGITPQIPRLTYSHRFHTSPGFQTVFHRLISRVSAENCFLLFGIKDTDMTLIFYFYFWWPLPGFITKYCYQYWPSNTMLMLNRIPPTIMIIFFTIANVKSNPSLPKCEIILPGFWLSEPSTTSYVTPPHSCPLLQLSSLSFWPQIAKKTFGWKIYPS